MRLLEGDDAVVDVCGGNCTCATKRAIFCDEQWERSSGGECLSPIAYSQ